MAIGAAQPDRADTNERLARPRIRDRLVVEPELSIGMQTESEHAPYCRRSDASERTGIQTRIASTARLAQAK
jgi:hypothetical protein